MSLTKSSPAYERWCEERRDEHDHTYTLYLESLYLTGRQRFPVDDEQPEQTNDNKPAERHNSNKP